MMNQKAVAAKNEVGIVISHHTSDSVNIYLCEELDYWITISCGALANYPVFIGN